MLLRISSRDAQLFIPWVYGGLLNGQVINKEPNRWRKTVMLCFSFFKKNKNPFFENKMSFHLFCTRKLKIIQCESHQRSTEYLCALRTELIRIALFVSIISISCILATKKMNLWKNWIFQNDSSHLNRTMVRMNASVALWVAHEICILVRCPLMFAIYNIYILHRLRAKPFFRSNHRDDR